MANSEIRDLVFKVRLDSSEIGAEVKKLQDQINKISATGGGAGGKGTTIGGVDANVITAYSNLFNQLKSGTVTAIELTKEMLLLGKQITETTEGFKNLVGGGAQGAITAMGELRVASQGLISDLDLMKAANQGALLGLDPRTFDEMAGAAVRLGQAVGRDAASSIDSFILGLSRGSALLLDNLGIVIDTSSAYQAFAEKNNLLAKELSEGEKKLAIQAVAMEAARNKVSQLGPAIENASTQYAKFAITLENSKAGLASVIANSQLLENFLRGATIAATNTGIALDYLFGNSSTAKAARLVNEIDALNKKIESSSNLRGFLSPGTTDQDKSALAAKQEEYNKIIDSIKSEQKANEELIAKRQKENEERIKAEGDRLRAEAKREAAEKEAIANSKAAAEALDQLIQKRDELAAKAAQENDLLGLKKALASGDAGGVELFAGKLRDSAAEALRASLSATLSKSGEGGKSAEVFAEILANEIKQKTAAALSSNASAIEQANKEFASKQLDIALEDAFKKGDFAGVAVLQEKIHNAAVTEITAVEAKRLIESSVGVEQAMVQANELANAQAKVGDLERARALKQAMDEAFKSNVDFFSDLLTPMFEGQAANFEDIFKDAAKRIAIGFASQMAASLAASLGLGNLGQLGSAGGLGQSLAASVGFGGGDTQTISQLIQGSSYGQAAYEYLVGTASSGASIAGTSAANFGGNISQGVGYSGGLTSAGTTAGAGYSFGTIATGVGYGAAAYGIYEGGTGLYENLTDNKKDPKGGLTDGAVFGAAAGYAITVASAAYAGATIGSYVPIIGTAIGAALGAAVGYVIGNTGGDIKKAVEREAREKVLSNISENSPLGESLTFGTVKGNQTLDPKNFNIDQSNPNSAYAVALANPLAQLVSQTDGKLSSDIAAIFANATDEADNYNEVLVNTLALMDGLDLTAQEAKQGLSEAFLDGKISVESFGADLQTLNILATESLIGPNSILEALQIIAKNIDGEGEDSPKIALKGLELEFKALAAAGYDSTEEIVGYFNSIGDPEIAAIFQKLGEIGVDSFDDIGNAIANSPDLVYALYNTILDLNSALGHTDPSGVEQVGAAAKGATSGVAKLVSEAKGLNKELDTAIRKQKELRGLGDARSDSSSQSLNKQAP